jgi:hypothetical protein
LVDTKRHRVSLSPLGRATWLVSSCLATVAASALISPAWATSGDDVLEELQTLRQAVAEQQRLIESQQRMIEELSRQNRELMARVDQQTERLSVVEQAVVPGSTLQGFSGAGPSVGLAPPGDPARTPEFDLSRPGRSLINQLPQVGQAPPQTPPPAPPDAPAQPGTQPQPGDASQTSPVGEDDTPERPEVEVISGEGGVLTPAGQISLEPRFEFTNTSRNVFLFRGVEIVDAILIGLIEASDSSRDLLQVGLTARLGVTDRLEVETTVPFVYREDRLQQTFNIQGQDIADETILDGYGLGDIEFAAHYQVNDGTGGWPFFIANLRVKPATGTGPFDVERAADGVATELATGSGFLAIEPSVTAIYPSSPLVFFGNLGYLYNMPEDIDQTFGETRIGRVDPGDSISASVGVAFSVNPQASLSFGYKHNYVFGTTTEINNFTTETPTEHVGALLLGGSYQISESTSINLTVEAGVTEAAPDVRVLFRVPIRFGGIF